MADFLVVWGTLTQKIGAWKDLFLSKKMPNESEVMWDKAGVCRGLDYELGIICGQPAKQTPGCRSIVCGIRKHKAQMLCELLTYPRQNGEKLKYASD